MPSRTDHQLCQERSDQIQSLLKRLTLDPNLLMGSKEAFQHKLGILNEALTHTSARAPINHERLEFLGDAVLRLAASEFIDRNFPQMAVGERSALRAQLVSDRWLTTVGQRIGIDDVLIIGPKATGDAQAQATLQAEATEALIGAIYEGWGSLAPIHQWLTPYWEDTSTAVLADPHRLNSKSALQEWSQGKGLGLPRYVHEERSQKHGDSKRFWCCVQLNSKRLGEGWGGSRREAEQNAARHALQEVSESATEALNNPEQH